MYDVLITDGHQRKTLSAIRSLGRKGLKTACCESTRMNPSGFSAYCSTFFRTPVPGTSDDEYLAELTDIIVREECKVLLPMDDFTTGVVIRNSDKLSRICDFALPDMHSFSIARDKRKAFDHAAKAGLRCPRTAPPKNDGSGIPDISELEFPLIIKPRDTSGARGMRVVADENSFYETYDRIAAKYPDPIVQEYISVSGKIDVCLIYNKNSELRASFVQKELRNYPEPLGPSTVQESITDERALELALRFMEGLNWIGPAELEFITDASTGEYIFMEINPRFWASLELAVRSGADFPYLYYQIAVSGDCAPVLYYDTGLRTRWLFPGEVLAFFDRGKNKANRISFFFAGRYGIINDTFSWRDPMPSFGVFLSAVYHFCNKERRRSILKR